MSNIANPEVAEAIRIADKHLAGESVERRKALAVDISQAMIERGGQIARGLLSLIKTNLSKDAP